MIFAGGSGYVDLDPAGSVIAVRHKTRPDNNYLVGTGLGDFHLNGKAAHLAVPVVEQDMDEVEVTWQVEGQPGITLRHTFTAGWGMRLAFVNLSSCPRRLDPVLLSVRAAPGNYASALAAGSEAGFSVAYQMSAADPIEDMVAGLCRALAPRLTGSCWSPPG